MTYVRNTTETNTDPELHVQVFTVFGVRGPLSHNILQDTHRRTRIIFFHHQQYRQLYAHKAQEQENI